MKHLTKHLKQLKLNNRFSRKSILYTWFLSYILILFLPLVSGIALYIQAKSIVEKQLVQYNEVISAMLLSENDKQVLENMKTVAAVSLNETIRDAFRMKGSLDKEEQVKLHKVSTEIANLHTQSYEVNNDAFFYIYLKNINRVVDSGYIIEPELFYRLNYAHGGDSYDTWAGSLEASEPKYYRVTDKNGVRKLRYVTPFPRNSTATGAFVIEQSFPALVETISGLAKDQISMEYIILSGRGDLFQCTSAFGDIDAVAAEKLFEQSDNRITLKGKGYYLQTQTSKTTGFRYLIAVTNPNSDKMLVMMRIFGAVMILLSLFGGALLILFMVRYNYSPIINVLEELRAKMPADVQEEQNELELIRKTVSKVIEENENISYQLDNQAQALQSYTLYEMLTGQLDMEFFDESQLKIHFPGNNFAVALFYVENYEKLFASDKDTSETMKFKTVSFILENIVGDTFKNDSCGYVVNVNGILALLLSFSERNAEKCRVRMMDAIREMKQLMEEKLFISFTISVSDVTHGIPSIEYAYCEALKTMKYKFSLGTNLIISQEDLDTSEDNQYAYPLEKEQMLINYVKTADFEGASALLDDIFANREMSPDIMRCLAYNMIGTILRMSGDAGVSDNEEMSEKLNSFETIDEFKENLMSEIRNLCDLHKTQKGDMLCAKVLKVIDEKYSDPNLSVSYIADFLDIQYVYLSATFKNYMGEGVLEYISKKRVNESKKYLHNPLLSIDNVAEMVGYTTRKTFVRVFRKYEGVTPAKYREHAAGDAIR